MAAVVKDKQGIGRFVVFNQLPDSHHELQMGILGGYGKDVGAERIILAQTLFQILELGKHKQIIRAPMHK